MKRIAFVSEYPASPRFVVGGVQAAVRQLAVEMAARGLDVHAVSTELDRSEPLDEVLEGVHVHRRTGRRRFGNVTMGRRERRDTAETLRRIAPDVVHAHVLGPPALGAMASGCAWVATAHGMQEAEARSLEGWVNRVRSSSRIRMERMSLRGLRHLIVISPYVLEYFGDLLRDVRVHPIENPVAEPFFRAEAVRDPGVILFTGRLIPRKDVATLLRAVSSLRSQGLRPRLRLAGDDGGSGHGRDLRDLAGELDLGDAVEFLGSLAPEEVRSELGRAGIWVQSSRQETASIALMEAMATGAPVLATDVGGTRHMVDHGRTGLLVPPSDPAGLAAALARFLREPAQAERMGRAARAEAVSRFRVSSVVDRTLAVYEAARADATRSRSLQSAGSGGRN
jgi:glycosyltransferase involved in cell wall biosynthesis